MTKKVIAEIQDDYQNTTQKEFTSTIRDYKRQGIKLNTETYEYHGSICTTWFSPTREIGYHYTSETTGSSRFYFFMGDLK